MMVNVVIDFLEYRIRAAVDKNLTDYKDVRYKEMTDALNSNQPAAMHKACTQLKPRPNKKDYAHEVGSRSGGSLR